MTDDELIEKMKAGLVACEEFTDYLEYSAADALELGIKLEKTDPPKWHWMSDIASMEQEWTVEEICGIAARTALTALREAGYEVRRSTE